MVRASVCVGAGERERATHVLLLFLHLSANFMYYAGWRPLVRLGVWLCVLQIFVCVFWFQTGKKKKEGGLLVAAAVVALVHIGLTLKTAFVHNPAPHEGYWCPKENKKD